jgi:hypothetical protein
MLDIVKKYFNQNGWQYTEVEDKNVLLFGINGKNGNFQCVADIDAEEKKFIFFSVCGANTPIEKKHEMLELINLLNYDLFFGNFEMDLEDGEIRFKTSVFYEFIEPSIEFINQIAMTNIIAMDSSLIGMMGLMFGNLTASEAFEIIKKEEETLY